MSSGESDAGTPVARSSYEPGACSVNETNNTSHTSSAFRPPPHQQRDRSSTQIMKFKQVWTSWQRTHGVRGSRGFRGHGHRSGAAGQRNRPAGGQPLVSACVAGRPAAMWCFPTWLQQVPSTQTSICSCLLACLPEPCFRSLFSFALEPIDYARAP
jgi:hypothetical protein